MPSLGEAPSGGAERFWLLLALFPKVTRCKSGTISGRNRSNGYTHKKENKKKRRSSLAKEKRRF